MARPGYLATTSDLKKKKKATDKLRTFMTFVA